MKSMAWSVLRILIELVMFLVGLYLAKQYILTPLLGLLPGNDQILLSLRHVVTVAVALGLYVATVRLVERRTPQELSGEGFAKDLAIGLSGGFAAISLVIGLMAMFNAYRIEGILPVTPLLGTAILIFLLAMVEELAFRGFLYRNLEASFGTIVALLVSAVLFGAVHLSNQNADLLSAVSAGLGGAFVGLFYTLSGRLWVPIFFHFSWNLSQLVWGARVSGADEFATLLSARFSGPAWLTGGDAGPENSVITLVLIAGILCGSFAIGKRRGRIRGGRKDGAVARGEDGAAMSPGKTA